MIRGGKTDGVGVHVLLRKIAGVPAFASQVGSGGAHVDVEGEFGDVVQIQGVTLPITAGVVAVVGAVAVPVRQASAAKWVIGGEGSVVGGQAVGDHHTVIFLTTILNRTGIGGGRRVVVRRHAAHVSGHFVVGFRQWRVGDGAQTIDRRNQRVVVGVHRQITDCPRNVAAVAWVIADGGIERRKSDAQRAITADQILGDILRNADPVLIGNGIGARGEIAT
ncbi:hypothetical protein D3C87_1441220 [compost metagenome]